jgi:hypothetical protein
MTLDIRDWRKIDAPWLSAALARRGIDAKVKDFTTRPVGTGQIGDCVRFTLTYDSAPADAPTTLVGKFPADGEASRATGVALWNYYREVKFYNELQATARIATPTCYFADVNEESHDFVLIMGDLSPAEQGDQLAGVTLDQAKLVAAESAKLNAAYWNDDSLNERPWVMETENAPQSVPPEMFPVVWDQFVERYGDRVSDAARHIGKHLSTSMEAYGELRHGSPRALIHADFRPDNMMFASDKGGAPITVVDWQCFAYGPPAADLGYFVAGALTAEERRTHGDEIIALYKAELARQGVADYADDMLQKHYVIGAYQLFLTAYFAAVMVTQTERGDNMFFRMLNGGVDLITDHGAEDWLA